MVLICLKEGGICRKKCKVSSPPVYITHYKRQKGLRNGLNLRTLNYRLASPGILLKEVPGKAEKEGLIVGTGGCCGSDPHPLTPTPSALLPAHIPFDLTTTQLCDYPSPAACPPTPPLNHLCFDVTQPQPAGNSHHFPFISRPTATHILLVTM